MKKLLLIVPIVIIAVFLMGCTQQQSFCKGSYLEFQKGQCCLDQNSNGACDKDESAKPQEVSNVSNKTQPVTITQPQINTTSSTINTTVPEKKINLDVDIYYGDEQGNHVTEVNMTKGWAYYYIWVINKGDISVHCAVVKQTEQGFFLDRALDIQSNSNDSVLISSNIPIPSTQIATVRDRSVNCWHTENQSLSMSKELSIDIWG